MSFSHSIQFMAFCFLFLANLLPAHANREDNKVVLGILAGRAIDRDIYAEMVERHRRRLPEIEFDYIVADDRGYKEQITTWLRLQKVDVSYGQAGTRLCNLASAGLIAPINDFWSENQLENSFTSNFKEAVFCNGDAYGIPIFYYYWGIFYKKSLFKKMGITPPKTWQQLLTINTKLKNAGITPFSIGTKNKWPAAAWFDYLNLRINGLSFHLALLKGKHSFNDPKVKRVMEHWKLLLSENNFLENKENIDWLQSMPFVYREHSAMILTGSFLANIIPQNMVDDFGFFRFPVINPDIPIYEEVPTDVYLINQLSASKKAVYEVLKQTSAAENQSWLASKLGLLPPHTSARISRSKFAHIGMQHIQSAAGHSQYFDRDASPDLSKHGPGIFADFMQDHDIDKALFRLEKVRRVQQFKDDIASN